MGVAEQKTPGRTTLLAAVNTLLMNIGEQPVDSLEDEQIQDARIAQQTLLEFHKDGQTRGWSWNTEYQYPFDIDTVSGEIVVPESAMTWLVNPYKYNGRFVLRGNKVYDKLNRTFKIASTDAPINADVIWLLSWDESPEAYNRWSTIRAARVFATRMLGSDSLANYTAIDEAAAKSELMQVELTQSQPNSLTGGPGMGPMPTYSPELGLRRGVYGGVVIG
jgi:hypothetical protein|tara:strand:- start:2267 stop:2926 length:660 start_codon:yes stop_codon:yes gene_type:complete